MTFVLYDCLQEKATQVQAPSMVEAAFAFARTQKKTVRFQLIDFATNDMAWFCVHVDTGERKVFQEVFLPAKAL